MKIKNASKFGDLAIEENKSEINPAFKPEVRCFKPEIEMLSWQNVQASRTSCLFAISTNYAGLVRPIKVRKNVVVLMGAFSASRRSLGKLQERKMLISVL